jgi:thioredoxin reductase (NADPH)
MFWGLMLAPDRRHSKVFRAGIMGADLMDAMSARAERFGAQMVRDDVAAVSLTCPVKTVTEAPAPPGRPAPSSWRGARPTAR